MKTNPLARFTSAQLETELKRRLTPARPEMVADPNFKNLMAFMQKVGDFLENKKVWPADFAGNLTHEVICTLYGPSSDAFYAWKTYQERLRCPR